jgi:membrane protein involved in colicin uptake
MEKMHVENEQKKNEEDQRKAKEMEAMHATEEQKKAEEHKQAADAMEVNISIFPKSRANFNVSRPCMPQKSKRRQRSTSRLRMQWR